MSKKDAKKKKRAEKRFKEIHSETTDIATGNRILVDKEIGVHYLFNWAGYTGGVTRYWMPMGNR